MNFPEPKVKVLIPMYEPLEVVECEKCGRCCRNTKWTVNLNSRLVREDIERWRREGRQDILQYVLVFEGLGGDLLDLNRMFLSTCPFLKKGKDRKYMCSIHGTKPFACRVTPFYFHLKELGKTTDVPYTKKICTAKIAEFF
ncbi:YkgJ family cysteine cluster protein [Candidatus Bathyarchaeota archaeon]|nr:YkgJ family cysteine cluster protein [Candidatus Bathyarchaeota archaeon]